MFPRGDDPRSRIRCNTQRSVEADADNANDDEDPNTYAQCRLIKGTSNVYRRRNCAGPLGRLGLKPAKRCSKETGGSNS
jgi:hypothetical protein